MTDKILIDRSVLEQALEALWLTDSEEGTEASEREVLSIRALRAALEQPQVEQDPIGEAQDWNSSQKFTHCIWDARVVPVGTKLYRLPPHRPPLPNEQMDIGWQLHGSNDPYQAWCMAVEWTERAHGIGGEA